MRCPQCGAETPDEEWNCLSCRINLYWATQHYEALARIRAGQGLRLATDTPPFLREAHAREMGERIERTGRVEHKVRQIARIAMRRHTDRADGPVVEQSGAEAIPVTEQGGAGASGN